MNNLFVNCNNCGQKLQIEDGIMFTTCINCHSTLEIVRTFNSVYTKAKEDIPTEIIPEIALKPMELDRNDIYKQIELLDREWQNTLPTFMVKGSLPDLSESSFNILSILFYIILATITGCGLFIGYLPLVVIGFSGLLFFTLLNFLNNNKSKRHRKYKIAKNKHEQKRVELIKSLEG